MKGWRPFFFPPSSFFTQWRASRRKPCHYFPSLCSNADVRLFKFFQLNRVPRESGTGVNSSNVDKRTRLIPCRCALRAELPSGGTLVLPSLERKRTPRWRKFNELRAKNIGDPVQLVLTVCLVFKERKEKEGNTGAHTSTLWRKCWYARSQESMLDILKV